MKKLTTIAPLLATALIAAPTIAADMDVDWFVGAGVGYQNDDVSGSNATNGEDASYELRGGAILNENHRVMGTVGYMDKLEQTKFIASYDYLYSVYDNINLFAGVSIGAADSEVANESSTEFVWGGQVGAMYEFNDNWTTELSYRYLALDFEEKGVEIDNTQQVVVSVDYRF
ncbi:porin family protein [Vibrio agarivorans]|uniref:porin family protein n=1 Tax=Vibrio agarivorans TaxID=153622 RepID=UPI0025B50ADE|nr:porin family protein [Vibrio agarivorans]MDN3660207.1 porin family protein [Vibrio agarivorans]